MGYLDTATQDQLDAVLHQLAEKAGMNAVLSIPGVYEIVREHWNNAMLQQWQFENRPQDDYLRDKDETEIVIVPSGEHRGAPIQQVSLVCKLNDEDLAYWHGEDAVRRWVRHGILDANDFHGSAYEHYKEAHSEGVRDFPLMY